MGIVTPEGKVKEQVKRILRKHRPQLYAHWPVQAGYGAPALDCNGAIFGRAFTIETKRAGQKPTPRQIQTMREMKAAGYKVFLIDGEKYGYTPLETWLAQQYKHR